MIIGKKVMSYVTATDVGFCKFHFICLKYEGFLCSSCVFSIENEDEKRDKTRKKMKSIDF